MVFERLEKGTGLKNKLPNNTISVNKSGVSLSADLKQYFEGFNFVEIYFDKRANVVGIKPSNTKEIGYSINQNKGNISFAIQKLTQSIPLGHYMIEFDHQTKMLLFTVKEIAY